MKVYTKRGDDGTTGLLYGGRVAKDDLRTDAYGTVDEACSALGIARAQLRDEPEFAEAVLAVQREMFVLGAQLATHTDHWSQLSDRISRVTAGVVDDLVRRRRAGAEIPPEEQLHCRYRADGTEADLPWSTFQLDGYGSWLWALGGHAARHGRPVTPFLPGVELSGRYIAAFWPDPCYDWWEERLGTHTATLAAVYAGLMAVAERDEIRDEVRAEAARATAAIGDALAREVGEGPLPATFGDGDRLDGSAIASATPFRLFAPDDPVVTRTTGALEAELAHGGVHRYRGDTYYGGGEWLPLAALLGWHYAEVGRSADAWAQLEWVAAQATERGDLPEQVSTHLEVPDALAEWERRWGPSASPLLWSHAMFLTLALELGLRQAGRPS